MYSEGWILDFVNNQILMELESNDVDLLAEETHFADPVHRFVMPRPRGFQPPPPPSVAAVDDDATDEDMPALVNDGSDGEGEGVGATSKPLARKKAARQAASAVQAASEGGVGHLSSHLERLGANEPAPKENVASARPRLHRQHVNSLRPEGKPPLD